MNNEPQEMQVCKCSKVEEWPEYSLIPDDFWPKDATIEDRYPYWRDTEWIPSEDNLENKKLVDDAIEDFKKKYPDFNGDVLKSKDFWGKFGMYDYLVSEAIRNRKYVLESDYDSWYDTQKHMKNFDVYIPFTIVDRMCQAEIVFNLHHRDSYQCNVEYDDYAKVEVNKVERKYRTDKGSSKEKRPNTPLDDELLEQWRDHGCKEYRAKQVQMIKEGHGKYVLKAQGSEFSGTTLWVEHKGSDYIIHSNIDD